MEATASDSLSLEDGADSACSSVGSEDEYEDVASALTLAAAFYADAFYFKKPCRTSSLSGAAWVQELRDGNRTRIFENFRMTKTVFGAFCGELDRASSQSCWSRVETQERAAIFLYFMSRRTSNRDLQERFQRSGETIHRHFHKVLDAVYGLAKKYIALPSEPSTILASQPKFASQFDKCRFAFDGTLIPAFVPAAKARPFRDRTGKLSQNVFAACTFDMMFAFVPAGWEGSAADSTVLADARNRGFTTPSSLFDLGDAGYALSMSVLTPYRGVRYHLKEWGQAQQWPQNSKELYNLRHAQARNAIERAFGVLKRRFPMLLHPPEFDVTTQAKMVVACCVLHNFVRLQQDPDDDPEQELEPPSDDSTSENGAIDADDSPPTLTDSRYAEAKIFRDSVANAMWNSYSSYRSSRMAG